MNNEKSMLNLINNEEVKLGIIKQFKDQTPGAMAAMFRDDMPTNHEWSRYRNEMRFTVEDIDMEFIAELVDDRYNDVIFQIVFSPLDISNPGDVVSCPFNNGPITNVYVESFNFVDDQIMFYLNTYRLIVKDFQFKIVDEKREHELLYDIISGSFVKNPSEILEYWDGFRSQTDATYIEYRHWPKDQINLKCDLSGINADKKVLDAVIDAFDDRHDSNWPDQSRMADIIGLLNR